MFFVRLAATITDDRDTEKVELLPIKRTARKSVSELLGFIHSHILRS